MNPLDEESDRRREIYLTTHNTHNRQTSMPPVGFKPTIPASKRPQTHALDRAATGVGHNLMLGLLQTKHLTNSDQWKEGHALTETHIFYSISERICMLSTRPSSPLLRDSTHTVQVNCIFFSKGQNISV